MTGAGLAAARKAKITDQFGPPADADTLDDWLLKDSEAIVEYIQANAKVPAAGLKDSLAGDCTGQASVI